MATARPAPVSLAPAADPTICPVTVNVFDGTRQLIKAGTQILFTIIDGSQNRLFRDFVSGPTVLFNLPIHNNFADNYSIVAFAEGSDQAGFQPVTVGPNAPQKLDVMLLPKNGGFNFAQAKLSDLQAQRPKVAQILAASAPGDPSIVYGQLMEESAKLACLLNLTTAMQQINLPNGTPLDYFKAFDIPALQQDRIFGYADAALVDQVKLAAQQGEFATEPAIDLTLHGDATSSFKQIQFGEANVQLTFHEKNTKTINGVNCVYVEPDIDYFKDLGAHILLEVIPNALTGHLTDPRIVYVLRWMAGQHAGIPNFDPLYTIQ
jgi:hypothetical protein